MFSEAVDMNAKEYIKSLGMETDEDYNLDLIPMMMQVSPMKK